MTEASSRTGATSARTRVVRRTLILGGIVSIAVLCLGAVVDAPATGHIKLVTSAFALVTTTDVDLDLSGLLATEIHIEGLQAIEVEGHSYAPVEAVDLRVDVAVPTSTLPALRPVHVTSGTRISVTITNANEVRVIFLDEEGAHPPLAVASRGAVEARLITEDGRAARLNVPTSGVVSMLRCAGPLDLMFTPVDVESCIACLPLNIAEPSFNREEMISSPDGPTYVKTSAVVSGNVQFNGLEAKTIDYGTPLFIDGTKVVLRRLAFEQPAKRLSVELDVAAARIRAGDAGAEVSLVPSYLVYYHRGPPAALLLLIFSTSALFAKAWEKYT